MRTQADRDTERAAVHARVAARVAACEQLPLGPQLAAGLIGLRAQPMDGDSAIRCAAMWTRLRDWCEAEAMVPIVTAVEQAELVARRAGDHFTDPVRLVGDELALATNVSAGSATHRVGLAVQLSDHLPAAWLAMDRGELSLAHLRKLDDALKAAGPKLTAAVEQIVVPAAVAAGLTPHELFKEATRVMIGIDPDAAEQRKAAAREADDVTFHGEPDETARIQAVGHALTMRQLMDAIDTLADQLGRDGDDRPVGQRRVTAMQTLILGAPADRPAAEVGLIMPLESYLGASNAPGELVGYGPVTAETARAVADNAWLRRLLTDPVTGTLIDLGRTRYRPTKPLERLIAYRDRTCRVPGCHRPAIRCDKDHRIDYRAGGNTSSDDMHSLCRRHHNHKTRKLWQVHRHPDGSETWTTAFGRTFTKPRPSYLDLTEPPPEYDDDVVAEPSEELLSSDPDPPREDDPLPETPTITLEDYFNYTDDIEQRIIAGANRYYGTCSCRRRDRSAA
jgi:hypothetical protein